MPLRVEKTDESYIRERLASATKWSDSYADSLKGATGPGSQQFAYSMVAEHLLTRGCCLYALGSPFEDVIAEFDRASTAWVEVFARRGQLVTEFRTPKGVKHFVDYSLTNSRDNQLASYASLLARNTARARAISSQAWDPPNSYVKKDSIICKPHEQRLAFALKHLLCDEHDLIEREVLNVRKEPKAPEYWEIEMMRGTRDGNSDPIVEAFEFALTCHSSWRKRGPNYTYNKPEEFLCMPACGLLVYALETGVVTDSDLASVKGGSELELVLAVTGRE